jgi:hypothetical protein
MTDKKKIGEQAFKDIEKINSELLSLTYGALVVQLLKDFESVEEVNNQLEKMGHKIGERLIDEYMSKSKTTKPCKDFKDAVESIAKIGMKMFLNINCTPKDWNKEGTQVVLGFIDNPLNDFVEIPEKYKGLNYSNLLCGVLRGCLEVVQMRVECTYQKCPLQGGDQSEIKLTLKEYLKDIVPNDE